MAFELKDLVDDLIVFLEGKQDLAEEMAGDLYAKYIAPINIPYIPDSIEKMFVDPMLQKLVSEAAAKSLDQAIERLILLRDKIKAENNSPVVE